MRTSTALLIISICNILVIILTILAYKEKIALREENCQLKGGTLVEKICVKVNVIK